MRVDWDEEELESSGLFISEGSRRKGMPGGKHV